MLFFFVKVLLLYYYIVIVIIRSANLCANINNNPKRKLSSTQKLFGMVLDIKLEFNLHLKNGQRKVNQTVELLHKLQNNLSREPLVTIYKWFIRSHLGYEDITYDRAYNFLFYENIYCYLNYKWVEQNFHNSENIGFFNSNILKFIQPRRNSIYNCHNPKGIRVINRFRLGLSHFCKHKYKHGFQDCLRSLSNTIMTKTLLFGDSCLSYTTNTLILNSIIDYVIATKRFDDSIVT